MQPVVKTPRTNIHIEGEIPSRILEMLKSEYGGELKIYEGDEKYVEVTESDWYKEIVEITTPGDAMRIYRRNIHLTQEQLGEKLGNIPRQIISNMECGKRSISLPTAKKLSVIFNVPASRFLNL
jgi:DNA-binding XRE family transcriptional regulator